MNDDNGKLRPSSASNSPFIIDNGNSNIWQSSASSTLSPTTSSSSIVTATALNITGSDSSWITAVPLSPFVLFICIYLYLIFIYYYLYIIYIFIILFIINLLFI